MEGERRALRLLGLLKLACQGVGASDTDQWITGDHRRFSQNAGREGNAPGVDLTAREGGDGGSASGSAWAA